MVCELPPGKKPLVSLVVLTCNRAAFLRLALLGAAAQTYRPIEVLVVDDGSVKAASLQGYGFTVRKVKTPRSSIGEKRNFGVRHSRGQIVMHWDDDDIRHPTHVSSLACPILRNWSDITSLTFSFLARLSPSGMQFFEYAAPGRHASRAATGPFLGSLAYSRALAVALSRQSQQSQLSRRSQLWRGRGLAASSAIAPFADASLSEDLHFVERALRLCFRMLPIANVPLVYTRHAAASVQNTWRPADFTSRMLDEKARPPPSFVDASLRAAYVAAEKETAALASSLTCTAIHRHEPRGIVRPLLFPYMPSRCCSSAGTAKAASRAANTAANSAANTAANGIAAAAAAAATPMARPCTDGIGGSGCGDESFCGATKGVCTASCTCAGEAAHGASAESVPCGSFCCAYWHRFWRLHPQNCSIKRMRPLKRHYCGQVRSGTSSSAASGARRKAKDGF